MVFEPSFVRLIDRFFLFLLRVFFVPHDFERVVLRWAEKHSLPLSLLLSHPPLHKCTPSLATAHLLGKNKLVLYAISIGYIITILLQLLKLLLVSPPPQSCCMAAGLAYIPYVADFISFSSSRHRQSLLLITFCSNYVHTAAEGEEEIRQSKDEENDFFSLLHISFGPFFRFSLRSKKAQVGSLS